MGMKYWTSNSFSKKFCNIESWRSIFQGWNMFDHFWSCVPTLTFTKQLVSGWPSCPQAPAPCGSCLGDQHRWWIFQPVTSSEYWRIDVVGSHHSKKGFQIDFFIYVADGAAILSPWFVFPLFFRVGEIIMSICPRNLHVKNWAPGPRWTYDHVLTLRSYAPQHVGEVYQFSKLFGS